MTINDKFHKLRFEPFDWVKNRQVFILTDDKYESALTYRVEQVLIESRKVIIYKDDSRDTERLLVDLDTGYSYGYGKEFRIVPSLEAYDICNKFKLFIELTNAIKSALYSEVSIDQLQRALNILNEPQEVTSAKDFLDFMNY